VFLAQPCPCLLALPQSDFTRPDGTRERGGLSNKVAILPELVSGGDLSSPSGWRLGNRRIVVVGIKEPFLMSAPSPLLPVLTTLLGPRQAEIMQYMWLYGATTVRELHTWLTRAEPLAYTSVMTTCLRLWERGCSTGVR